MIHTPLRERGLRNIVYMLLLDAVALWVLFSWQYLDALFSGQGRPVEPLANAVLVVIAVLGALTLTLRIPGSWKDAIVFWRVENAFPARRAFSVLARNDYRYRPEALQRKIGPFPEDPAAQQELWFGLYRKYEGRAMVVQMYRQYLLCYEIAAVSMLQIIPTLVLAAILWSSQELVLMGPLLLLGQYAMFAIATRFMADNLVQGVLALEATSS